MRIKLASIATGALALVGVGAAVGVAATEHSAAKPVVVQQVSSSTYYMPLAPGYKQSEPVSKVTYSMCMTVINATRAQILAAPKDQRAEMLRVEDWCNALAIRTNPVKAHNG